MTIRGGGTPREGPHYSTIKTLIVPYKTNKRPLCAPLAMRKRRGCGFCPRRTRRGDHGRARREEKSPGLAGNGLVEQANQQPDHPLENVGPGSLGIIIMFVNCIYGVTLFISGIPHGDSII